MLARLRKAQEENESGFTLIELLVVIMIIGILAAIAVPTFLGQREKAYSKAASAAAASFALAQESIVTEEDGAYTTVAADLKLNGYSSSSAVTIYELAVDAAAGTYTACFKHDKGGDSFVVANTAAAPAEKAGGCTGAATPLT